MLDLTLKLGPVNMELWDRVNEKFINIKKPEITVKLKHNLIAISRWESKWKKPLLHTQMNIDELLDYVNCMRISGPEVEIEYLNTEVIEKISTYMNDPMSATTIKQNGGSKGSKTIYTNEVIYSLMALAKIPFSCEKWHINRLFMLLSVNAEHRSDPKKKSESEIQRENASLNRARMAAMGKMKRPKM